MNGFACHRFAPRNGTVVAANILWRSMPLDHFLHDTANGFRVDMAIDMDDRTFAGLLVEDGQHFETPTADRFIVDKIPAPNMAGMFGFCLQAGGDTPAAAFWLALGDRQAQFTSQTLHETFTHMPAFVLQQLRDLGIAPPGVLP